MPESVQHASMADNFAKEMQQSNYSHILQDDYRTHTVLQSSNVSVYAISDTVGTQMIEARYAGIEETDLIQVTSMGMPCRSSLLVAQHVLVPSMLTNLRCVIFPQ